MTERKSNYKDPTRARRFAAGGMAAFIASVTAVAVTLFNDGFSSSEPVTVFSERSGLVLDKDAKVRARGVEIGKVESISQVPGGSRLELELDPDAFASIPANSQVKISSNTIFGAKGVNFLTSAEGGASGPSLKPGATVNADSVTTEVNEMFERLTELLESLEPEKLNATLSAISTTLDGRGDDLGRTIDDLSVVLDELNPSLDTLQRDLQKSGIVLGTYGDQADELMSLLDNSRQVGNNLVQRQAQFEVLLDRANDVATNGKTLLDTNGATITKTVKDLRSTMSLLAEYSPAMNCLIVGLNQGVLGAGPAFGAENQGGLVFNAGFHGKVDPYRFPEDLPKVNAKTGPKCNGLPFMDPGQYAPFVVTDVGSNPVEGKPYEQQQIRPHGPANPQLHAPSRSIPSVLEFMLNGFTPGGSS